MLFHSYFMLHLYNISRLLVCNKTDLKPIIIRFPTKITMQFSEMIFSKILDCFYNYIFHHFHNAEHHLDIINVV